MMKTFYGNSSKKHFQKNIIYFNDKPESKNSKTFAFLSPYYPSNFNVHKRLYHNVLQYYYATKFESWNDVHTQIILAHSAQEAYLIAKRNSLTFKSQFIDWKSKRLQVMKTALQEKFNQNPVLMQKLKLTGNSLLIYLNDKSMFWGSSLMNSHNMMGSLLMNLRDESKKNNQSTNPINKNKDIIIEIPQNKTVTNFKSISKAYLSLNNSTEKLGSHINPFNTTYDDLKIQTENSKVKRLGNIIQKKSVATNIKRNTLAKIQITFNQKYSSYDSGKDEISNDTNHSNSNQIKQLFHYDTKAKFSELALPFLKSGNRLEVKKQDPMENSRNIRKKSSLNTIQTIQEAKFEFELHLREEEIQKKKKMKEIARRIKAKIHWNKIQNALKIKTIQNEEADKLITEKTDAEKSTISSALIETSPFMFLTKSDRNIILEEGYLLACKKHVYLCESDTLLNKCCFIVIHGEIHVMSNDNKFLERLGDHTYFGIDGPLFDIRLTKFLAIIDSMVFVIRQKTLYKILKPNTMFAINVARNLINKQNILSPIIQLKKYFRQTVLQDSINVLTMMEIYKKIDSCLHPKCNSRELDTDSWLYAIRRLPDNLASSFSILITFSKTPDLLSFVSLKPIKSPFRTRSIFELMPGKILIVLKEMETDLMDFLANICIHLVESAKLALKINSPSYFRALQASKNEEETNKILDLMGFSEFEIKGLRKIWPKNLASKLVQVIMHRNNFLIQVRTPTSNIKQDPIEKWTIRLWKATSKLLNFPENTLCCDIPDNEFTVDILQGSRRGFLGVISPYIFKNKEKIFAWAVKAKPKIITKQFLCEEDKLMAYSYHYFQDHPEEEYERIRIEEECGIVRIDENDFTGIAFVIVNAKKLHQEWVDPKIKLKFNTRFHIIINIGYTFGAQSSDIMRAIVVVFGRKMKTLNIVGKAGGFVGHKGEILVATKIMSEENMEVVVNNLGDFNSKKLEKETCTPVHL